ncbi:hypothetical protein D1007_61479 [Hordeum vulgare]|nr:hypothetical protein D1007_61479 [Hordeum vulgare]
MASGRRRLSNATSSRSTSAISRLDASPPPAPLLLGVHPRGRLVLADHHSGEEKGEELGPLVVQLEEDAGELCGGVIGPEDYLPRARGSPHVRHHATLGEGGGGVCCAQPPRARDRADLAQQGVTASQASASKEADLRVLKPEQDKIWIDLDSDED